MTITKDICSVCEEFHDIELLKVGGDHGVLYKVWRCVSTNETWESIQAPKNLDEWAEMYLYCESEACGNVWCEDCTRVWDELMQGKRAAQHHAHLTPETQAQSQAVVNASALEQSDGDTSPAQAQVA